MGRTETSRNDTDDLADDFVVTARETLARLAADLVVLEQDPAAPAPLAGAFRSLRTLRVAASFLDFEHLAALAGAAEDMVVEVRQAARTPDPDMVDALSCVIDAGHHLVDAIASTGTDGTNPYHGLRDELRRLGALESSPEIDRRRLGARPPETIGQERVSTLRVECELLDELGQVADRLLVARNELMHQQRRSRSAGLAGTAAEIDAVTADLRRVVERTRREPILRAWSRLPRFARDLAIEQGRLVELHLAGGDTAVLDHRLLDLLREPVAELLAAVIEHGVEPPEVRTASGRAPRARIAIAVRAAADRVAVEITHDGPAVEPPAGTRRRLEAHHAAIATDDTDAVSRIRIDLPVPDAPIVAALVRCADTVFAVPASVVIDTFALDLRRSRIDEVAGAEVVDHHGRLVPLVWLRDVLCVEPPATHRLEVVLLEHQAQAFGLVVDRVLPTEELLTRDVPVPLATWGPFASTAVCGSGAVALVLDVDAIVATIGIDGASPRRTISGEDADMARTGPVRVLAARIGETTLTIPTALVAELASTDPGFRPPERVTVDTDGRPLSILAIPDLTLAATSGARPVIVHERGGRRFGIVVDEVLGEHHFPRPTRSSPTAIGIAASPIIGHRIADGIDLDDLIRGIDPPAIADQA